MSLAQRLVWLDGVFTVAILAAAVVVWAPAGGGPAWLMAARVAVVGAVCLAAFYYNDLYDFEEVPHDTGELFTRLCRALALAAFTLAVTYLVFPHLVLGGNLASYALLVTLIGVLALRTLVYALAKRPPFSEGVVIMGGGALASEVADHIRRRPDLALRLVGVLTPDAASASGPRLGGYADVADVVSRHRAERVIVAMPERRGSLPVTDLLACRFRGVRVEDGTQVFERFTRRLAVESLTPSALIFGDGFRVSRTQLALKRALSVVIAVVGLVAAAPVVAALAVLIKLESRGPVFFVQERVGLHGRPFRLVKFRTMRELEPADDEVWQRDNASRVTRVGAVLRRYRLDEIPQFFNILRGDMSLVGPRPEMATNVATLAAAIPFYSLRHEVRPGLTGWAQIKAGYAMTTEEVTRKLCYDLYYIKHLSLAFDLRILFDTVKFVLSGKRPG
jgi:exopolysaccharide biosynthesis polyprenyl glycosylphosphotransferase